MKSNNFYNRIKALLNTHSVSSNHDVIWNNVKNEMLKRKRRKRFLILFLIPMAIALIVSPIFFWQNDINGGEVTVMESSTIYIDVPVTQQKENSESQVNSIPETQIETAVFEQKVYSSSNKDVNSKSLIVHNKFIKLLNETDTKQDKLDEFIGTDDYINRIDQATILNKKDNTISYLKKIVALDNHGIDYSSEYTINRDITAMDFNQAVELKHWDIGFYFASGLLTNSFSTNDEQYSTLVEKRRESEMSVEELSLATELSYHFNNNWYLTSGIEYSRLIEKFESSYSQSETTNQIVLLGTVINSRGTQVEEIYGNGEVTINRSAYQKTYNRYHILSIPLVINYKKVFNKIIYGAHAGLSLQSLFSVSGEAFNMDKLVHLEDYSLNENEMYTSSFHVNAIIGLNLAYQASPNWNIYAAPEFIGGISGLSDASSALKHNINRYRVRVGIRYKL